MGQIIPTLNSELGSPVSVLDQTGGTMNHRDNTRCSHPLGIPQVLGRLCQMLSVTQEIPVVLRIGVRVHVTEPKILFVLSTRASGGPGLEPGVRVQVTATAWSQLRPRHELEGGFSEHFQPWAVDC